MNHRPGVAIEIVGHGGAGDFFAGNSESSVKKALELGVDRIEIDVLMTGSQELVLFHDAKLRDSNGRLRPLSSFTTDQVRGHADEMLTLNAFFELVGPKFSVLLDIKRPGYERAIVETLARHGSERDVWISTTHARSILTLRSLTPAATFGLSSGHIATAFPKSPFRPLVVGAVRAVTPVPLIAAARLCGAKMVMVNFRACSPELVRAAHAARLNVACWTVNRPADIARIASMGVDAVISNRPDLAREVVSGLQSRATVDGSAAAC